VPAEELPVPTAPGAIDQETQLADANRPTLAAVEPPARRRSGRARAIAALAAVVLAAGGGYGGYKLVMSRPVTVTTANLSVEVPREWREKSTTAGTNEALLVSTKTGDWQTTGAAPGVFVGVLSTATLPSTTTPPAGCSAAAPDKTAVDNQPAVTFQYDCGDKPQVVERYLKVSATQSLQIQVRSSDPTELNAVLQSVKYR
jgi:hypothetical protein